MRYRARKVLDSPRFLVLRQINSLWASIVGERKIRFCAYVVVDAFSSVLFCSFIHRVLKRFYIFSLFHFLRKHMHILYYFFFSIPFFVSCLFSVSFLPNAYLCFEWGLFCCIDPDPYDDGEGIDYFIYRVLTLLNGNTPQGIPLPSALVLVALFWYSLVLLRDDANSTCWHRISPHTDTLVR